jgi:hypothetical protein
MLDEAREAPGAVARLLAADGDVYASLGAELRERPPQSLLTIARGSSDHAAHYMAYLIMARLGRLVTSLPMASSSSRHVRQLNARRRSGRRPDHRAGADRVLLHAALFRGRDQVICERYRTARWRAADFIGLHEAGAYDH